MSTSRRRKELMELLAPMSLNGWQRNQIIMFMEMDRSRTITKAILGTTLFIALVCLISYTVFHGW